MTADMPAPRLDSLTGLRYLAAMAVVLLHATASRANGNPLVDLGDSVGRLTELGYLGVTFFFCLSGFVLTWTGSAKHLSGGTFYLRRIARIYPLHMVTTLLAGVTEWTSAGFVSGVGVWVGTLLLVQAWVPSNDWHFALNGVSWSLSCEAFFYALMPVLLPWAQRRSVRHITLVTTAAFAMAALVSILVIFRAPSSVSHLWVSPAFSLPVFLAGIALATASRRGVTTWPSLAVSVMILVGTLTAIVAVSWAEPAPRVVGTLLASPGIVLVLGSLARREMSGQSSWLGCRWMVKLGEWSFALYLVHPFVLHGMKKVPPSAVESGPTGLLLLSVFLMVATLASVMTYKLIERPAERLIRFGTAARRIGESGRGI